METGTFDEYFKFFIALLAIANPIGAIPIFINITSNQDKMTRDRNGLKAAVTMGTVLVIVLFTGEAVLRLFGISVGSFRIGGGILILLMAISMLNNKMSDAGHTTEDDLDSDKHDSLAVVPLGTPLLAGPGAISTVIVYAQRHSSIAHYLYLVGAILLLACLTLLLLRLASTISRMLGKTGINIATRIMGLIMAAMGVEFITHGIKQLFPILVGS